MSIALIDGDIVAYRCASSCSPTKTKLEEEPLDVAIYRTNELMKKILYETGTEHYKLYIGGKTNFRKQVDPLYKANRTKPPPTHLKDVRDFLISEWKAEVTSEVETDDMLGIDQTDSTIICSIDKDLLQIPGKHYNFVTSVFTDITESMGRYNFYTQLIMGDKSDNVPGYDGKARTEVPKFLQPMIETLMFYAEHDFNDWAFLKYVYELYDDKERFFINGKLLYILRSLDEDWIKIAQETMERGQKEDLMGLSQEYYGQGQDDGLPNTNA